MVQKNKTWLCPEAILFAARWYAGECSFLVLPTKEDKGPACLGGHKSATKDGVKIQSLFDNCTRTTGVGIRTGLCSGILVLDVDSGRKDQFGHDPLDLLAEEFGDEWQDTWRVETPSGGHHFYFSLEADEILPGKIGMRDGVDVKCEKGYVVAPPSLVAGKEYSWVNTEELPRNFETMQPVPDWLFGLIKTSDVVQEFNTEGWDRIIRTCSFPFLRSILNHALSRVRQAKKGQRKWTLYRQAWRLGLWVPYGLDYAIALTALSNATQGWSDIPRQEITDRLVPGLDRGVRDAYNGDGPSIPLEELERWEQEDILQPKRRLWLLQVEQWLQLPENCNRGVSIDEILTVHRGSTLLFGGKKAARNAVSKSLSDLGFINRQLRRDGVRMRYWFRCTLSEVKGGKL